MRKVYYIKEDIIPLVWEYDHSLENRLEVKNHVLLKRIDLLSQHGDSPIFCGALRVEINYNLKMPSYNRGIVDGDYHSYRPNFMYLIRYVLKILHKTVIRHQDMISELVVVKRHSKEPGLEITISSLRRSKC